MAIRTTNKKRDRITMSTPSSAAVAAKSTSETEEYERAVAFLREFHSRRVAALDSFQASSGLDAIIEAEDMLASDFELALSVTEPWENNKKSSAKRKESDDVPPSPPMRRSSSGLSRMKKASTSKCLLDLDDSVKSSSSYGSSASISSDDKSFSSTQSLSSASSSSSSSLFGLGRTSSASFAPLQEDAALEVDYYLGYDEAIYGPVTKRHCGHLGFARS